MFAEFNESSRKEVEILRILSQFRYPVGSTVLRRELERRGFHLNDRTIRYHLKLLQAKGMVKGHGRQGRTITVAGLEELERALAYQRLGSVLTRYLALAYSITYDPLEDKGKVVANISIIGKKHLDEMLDLMVKLCKMKLLPAPYFKVLREGEEYQGLNISRGKVAVFTVCNLTIDGVLIKAGIPIMLKYGGLAQFVDYRPVRFVELLSYAGTTLPPMELLVYRGVTSIRYFLDTGSGILPLNFREAPAEAREQVTNILDELKSRGWGGIIQVGHPNEPVLGVPVAIDRFGICIIGGLIPGAIMREAGVPVETLAPHCLIPIEDMERLD
jgi:hypothetical protein